MNYESLKGLGVGLDKCVSEDESGVGDVTRGCAWCVCGLCTQGCEQSLVLLGGEEL